MGETIIIELDKCYPGMELADDIFNRYGAVIVGKNTIISDHIIKKLKYLDVEKIKIFQKKDSEIAKAGIEFKYDYLKQSNEAKNLMENIILDKAIDSQRVENSVSSIIRMAKRDRDVLFFVNQVRGIDEYTYTHSLNVALLSSMLGKWMGLNDASVKELAYAGLLHDIGKYKVDLSILNKPGKLEPGENEQIKQHVTYGYRMVQNINGVNKEIASSVLMHHERSGGEGYPLRVKKEQIPLYAKIVAVADVYDAIISNKVYKSKQNSFAAFQEIEKGFEKQYDQDICSVFLNAAAKYFIGERCKLNNGEIGEIVYIKNSNVTNPLIKIGNDYIYLSKDSNLKIEQIL